MAHEERQTPLRVFVLGNARSGTSIMSIAINEFFKLPGTRESHVMPVFRRMLSTFEKYELIKHPRVLANRLRPELARAGLREMARSFYNEQFPGGSWLDKTPGAELILTADLIEECFPDARLVVMRRNGIEVVELFRKKFSASFAQACGAWSRGMAALAKVKGSLNNAIVVDQYDLTNDALETSRLICWHLNNTELGDAMAKFFQTTSQDKLSTHERSHRLTLADAQWSSEEKELFVNTCGKWMETWGYPM